MITRRINELRVNETINDRESFFYKSVLWGSVLVCVLIPVILIASLPVSIASTPVFVTAFIGILSVTFVAESVTKLEMKELKQENESFINQFDGMSKQIKEDSIIFYKNRFDLLDLPFIPEDMNFKENIIEDDKLLRVYNSQGFTMAREDDNRWTIATPEKKSSSYKFKTAFDAYHTLKSLGYDHSSWDQSMATKNIKK